MPKPHLVGYDEARKIDEMLSDLASAYPIEDNTADWLKLTRTVKTTLDLIEHAVMDELVAQQKITGFPQ